MTIEELGQKTKQKYPQYQNMSDAEVGQKVVAKYPQYQAQITPVSGSEKVRSGIQSVFDFLGLGSLPKNATTAVQSMLLNKGVGESNERLDELIAANRDLIARARREQDPARKQLLLDQSRKMSEQIGTIGEQARGFADEVQQTSQITENDMGRSNAEFALRRGAEQSAQLGSYVLPGAAPSGAATAAGRIGQAAVRGGIAGGLQGTAEAAREAETSYEAIEDVLAGVGQGAVAGAVIQGAFETPAAIKNAIREAGDKVTPTLRKMYAGTLKENIADKKFFKQFGGVDKVVDEAIEMRLPNTRSGMQKAFEEYQDEFGNIVKKELAKPENANKTVNMTQARKAAEEQVKKQFESDATLKKSALKWLKENQNTYKGKTDLTKANELRIGLDKTVGGKIAQDINQGPAAAKKALASAIRSQFKEQVPALSPFSRKYQLMSGLASAMKKEPAFGLAEITSTVGGSAALNAPGALLGYLTAKAGRSPGLRRAVASAATNLVSGSSAQGATSKAVELGVNPLFAAMDRYKQRENEAKQSNRRLP